MPNTPTPYQSFAITLLLCTPSSLHQTWMKPGQDWPTLVNLLTDLKFSEKAINNAKEEYYERLKSEEKKPVREAMINMASKLKGQFYPPNGPHPMDNDARNIVLALRRLDEKPSK